MGRRSRLGRYVAAGPSAEDLLTTPGFISRRRDGHTSASARRISPSIFSMNARSAAAAHWRWTRRSRRRGLDLLSDAPQPRYAIGIRGIQSRPDVQAPHAGVTVEAGPGTVFSTISSKRPVNSSSRSGGTAASSTNATGFSLSVVPSRSGSVDLRSLTVWPMSALVRSGVTASAPTSPARSSESCEAFVQPPSTTPLYDEDGFRIPCTKRVESL